MACNCNEDNKLFESLDEFIVKNGCVGRSSLIKVLHYAQNIFGYLPRNVQIHVAKKLEIPVSHVYGVISFYSYFTDTPRGENVVSVCIGTACFVKGADKVLEQFEKELNLKTGETSEDMKFTLSGVRCVGACGLAPVVLINDKVYGHVKPEEVKQIIEDYLIESAATN